MEVEIKFKPSGRNGIVAVGSYLADAARRLGVELDADENFELADYEVNIVQIVKGGELLSKPTKIEIEHLTSQSCESGQRLAGQAKIEKAGEIVVMVAKKKKADTPKTDEKMEEFRKEFDELPLEKKVANLLEMEVATLSETFYFVLNSPSKIFGKVMDVMAEFGLKMEDDAKRAKRPNEHKPTETRTDKSVVDSVKKENKDAASAKPKTSARKSSTQKKAAKPKTNRTVENIENNIAENTENNI